MRAGDRQLQYTTLPRKEDFSIAVVTNGNDNRCKSPSVSSDDDWTINDLGDGSGAILDFESRDEAYRDGGLSEDGNQELDHRGLGTDDDSADDSAKTECVSLDSEEEAENPYDRPHVLRELQDLGDGR